MRRAPKESITLAGPVAEYADKLDDLTSCSFSGPHIDNHAHVVGNAGDVADEDFRCPTKKELQADIDILVSIYRKALQELSPTWHKGGGTRGSKIHIEEWRDTVPGKVSHSQRCLEAPRGLCCKVHVAHQIQPSFLQA